MSIREKAANQLEYAIRCRRWLHRHAELAWKEFETTEFIVKELRAIGIEPHLYPDHTGCSALIRGGKAGADAKTILLRADIDAMPGMDVKDIPYASKYEGAVHSCGHDAHTAMLLATAKILYEQREELTGNVKLVFEAAEEIGTGGGYYVEQGILDGVDAVFGMHLWSELGESFINIEEGPRFSNFNIFRIKVHGFADATMNPHLAGDAIKAASKIVDNLQILETCMNHPLDSTVVAVGTMHGGYAPNTYCDYMEMTGTVRTFSMDFENHLDERIERIVKNTAEMMRCTAEVEVSHGAPAVIQDDEAFNTLTQNAAKKLFGEDVLRPLLPSLGSDTFGYYMQEIPGVFALLGCVGEQKEFQYPLHNDRFNFNEAIMERGIALFVQVVHDFFDRS